MLVASCYPTASESLFTSKRNSDEMVGSPRPSAETCHYSLMIRQKLQDLSGLHKLTRTRAILTRIKNLKKQDIKMKVAN